ncbi:hypothetical protein ZWY2020_029135 [Hordeum vulgare]|nr:hypothetical protein ZWY2020_029135 [Hordeum vulgare]
MLVLRRPLRREPRLLFFAMRGQLQASVLQWRAALGKGFAPFLFLQELMYGAFKEKASYFTNAEKLKVGYTSRTRIRRATTGEGI